MTNRAVAILVCGLIVLAFINFEPTDLHYPINFPEPAYNFENNPLNTEKIELGRALFYDPILSKDGTISCASCHSPYNAFAHTDHDLSHGINDQIGNRNAPALFNLAWQSSFMWDGAINHLDVQALAPISNALEMGESIANVVSKLQEKTNYPIRFSQAFGDSLITGEHVLKALSQFQLTLISGNSKYDKVVKGESRFTMQEANGLQIFRANCSSCHAEPLFSTYEFANNGLPIDTTLNDFGKGEITHLAADSGLFKIPSLRNLSFTHPYMHDGRFDKISEVLNHYTKGIVISTNLANELKTPIKLTSNEKIDLTAFLLTLNDTLFVFDAKHQFPRERLIPTEGN